MNKNFPPILMFYLISLMLIFSLENWFSLWLILELNTLTFIPLMMSVNSSISFENSISYFLTQTVSSLILMASLIPMLLFNFFFSPSLIFCSALAMKLAIGPLQMWMFVIGISSPWVILGLLLTIQKIIPLLFFEYLSMEMSTLLIYFCTMSLMLGTLSNMGSNSLKYMMIFSSISGMSWILISINFSSKLWKIFVLIYFSSLGFMLYQNMKKNKKNQNLLMFLNWLSVGGMPPLYGFLPKLTMMFIFMKMNLYFLMSLFIFFSLLDTYIYLRVIYSSFILFSSQTQWQTNMTENKLMKTWMALNITTLLLFY